MRQNQVLLNCFITPLLWAVPNGSLSDKVQEQCWEKFTPRNNHSSQLVETAPGLLCPLRNWLHSLPSFNIIATNFAPQISHKTHPSTYIASVPCCKNTQEGYFMPLHYFSHSGATRDPEETSRHTVQMQPACSTASTDLVITVST